MKPSEENYKYRMNKIIENFVECRPDLQGLCVEDLQDELWDHYPVEFAHDVLEDISKLFGDQLFEFE